MVLWEEYRDSHPDGYGYSRFCDLFRSFERRLSPVMRQHHVAGDKTFVDYSGKRIAIADGATGEIRAAEIFVAVLGASYAHIRIMCRSLAPRGVEGGSAGRDLTIIKGSGGTAAADRAVGIEAA